VKESITIIPETSILIIIEDLFTEIRERNDSYFHNLEPKEGMVDALARAIRGARDTSHISSICPVISEAHFKIPINSCPFFLFPIQKKQKEANCEGSY
jgi:hypothetical protein